MKPFVDIHTHGSLDDDLVGLRSYRLGIESPTDGCGAYSLGIHPWDVCRVKNAQQLLVDLRTMNCSAIGEIGMDRVCDTDLGMQRELFEQQVNISTERNLPMIIHCVKAQQEVGNILAHYSTPAVIFHGFVGSLQQAEQLWKRGFHLSFGFGVLQSPKTQEALRHCPTELLFLESDTAQEPISALYERVAQLRGVDMEVLKRDIYNNYNRVFK